MHGIELQHGSSGTATFLTYRDDDCIVRHYRNLCKECRIKKINFKPTVKLYTVR